MNIKLTNLEAYCLYHYCRGKTIRQISNNLKKYDSHISDALNRVIDKLRRIDFELWKKISFGKKNAEYMLLDYSNQLIDLVVEHNWIDEDQKMILVKTKSGLMFCSETVNEARTRFLSAFPLETFSSVSQLENSSLTRIIFDRGNQIIVSVEASLSDVLRALDSTPVVVDEAIEILGLNYEKNRFNR